MDKRLQVSRRHLTRARTVWNTVLAVHEAGLFRLDKVIVAAITTTHYSCEDILAYRRYDVTPPRAVRKAIFSLQLWLSYYIRRTIECKHSRRCLVTVNASSPLGIDPTNVPPQPAGSQPDTEQSSSPAADTVTTSATGARCQKNASSPRLLQSLKFGLLNARSIGNKSSTVADIITEGLHDVFLITETWHTSAEDTALRRCVPPGYMCLEAARPSRNIAVTNHGGVAAIITKRLKSKVIRSVSKVTSFESLCFSVTNCSNTVIILLVYRTGPVTDMFFSELQSYLETIALYKCQIIISGDFNIHVERQNDNDAIRLNEILRNFDCRQHVSHSMTHRDGGTLDLVITKSGEQIEAMSITSPDVYSNHSLISWRLPFVHQPPILSPVKSECGENFTKISFVYLFVAPACAMQIIDPALQRNISSVITPCSRNSLTSLHQ